MFNYVERCWNIVVEKKWIWFYKIVIYFEEDNNIIEFNLYFRKNKLYLERSYDRNEFEKYICKLNFINIIVFIIFFFMVVKFIVIFGSRINIDWYEWKYK